VNTICQVRADFAPRIGIPVLHGHPLDVGDPRVLRGLYDAISATPGVTGCDLLTVRPAPLFVVTVSDRPLTDEVQESLRLGVAALHEGSVQFSVAWSEDGGIKTALLDLTLEVV
jgi:hypothetical protein